jgi:hypothetical protein
VEIACPFIRNPDSGADAFEVSPRGFKNRLYTITHTYEGGRNGLVELRNWLNVTRNLWNAVEQAARVAGP